MVRYSYLYIVERTKKTKIMKIKVIDLIKENDKYYFVFRKNGNIIKHEVNIKAVDINGQLVEPTNPFGNITKLQVFCTETNLIKITKKQTT